MKPAIKQKGPVLVGTKTDRESNFKCIVVRMFIRVKIRKKMQTVGHFTRYYTTHVDGGMQPLTARIEKKRQPE